MNNPQDRSVAYEKIYNLCDPDFEDASGKNCTIYDDNDWCESFDADAFLAEKVQKNGWWGYETGLNCPECGCNVNPISLYDV